MDVVGSGEVLEPWLVSGLLESSSGSVAPSIIPMSLLSLVWLLLLRYLEMWDQTLSLEKLKDFCRHLFLFLRQFPCLQLPFLLLLSWVSNAMWNRLVMSAGPGIAGEWYRARLSGQPGQDLSRFPDSVLFLTSASLFICNAFGHVRFQAVKVCVHLHNGVCYQGERCSFARNSTKMPIVSQFFLACELDDDFEEFGA